MHPRIKKSFVIVVLFLVSNITFAQVTPQQWTTKLLSAIQIEIDNHFEKHCEQEHYHSSISFFKSELTYFPIVKAFEHLDSIRTNNRIKKRDRFYLRLYYPAVGFDPETGYQTDIVWKRKCRKLKIWDYRVDEKVFQKEQTKRKQRKVNMDMSSDCYGTGYYLITAFDADLNVIAIETVLALELQ